MKPHDSLSRIEILESRITPAGNVLAQLIGGHLIVTGDAQANAFEIVETDGGTETTVAYLLSPADTTTTINGASDPVTISGVTGDVRVSLGAGNDLLRVGNQTDAFMRTIRDLKIDGGAGDNVIELHSAGTFQIGRNAVVTNGAGDDRIETSGSIVVRGDLIISNGAGSSSTRFGGDEGDFIGAVNARISTGVGAQAIVEIHGASFTGNLAIQAATAAVARVSIGACEAQALTDSTISGNLQIVTGGGADEVTLTSVDVLRKGSISTGAGADFVQMDDAYIRGDFLLDTGRDADVVKLDTREGTSLSTAFDGRVRVDLGAGDDLLRLGVAGSVASSVETFRASSWDGGAGDDRVDAANLVASGGTEPTFVRFERYGAEPLFGSPRFLAAGPYIIDVVTADFNGDGNLDLVTSNNDSTTLSLLFGDRDGTFAPAVTIDLGTRPDGLAVGNFDERNGLDLVVATGADRGISVLLNDGTGHFGPRTIFPLGREVPPIAVVVADFNGDAKPDVATLNISDYQASSVGILLGAGDGTFAFLADFELTGPNIDYFGSPNDIAFGDLNGDGKLDLATTGLRGFGVLLGNGDGTFEVSVEKRDIGSRLHLADVNVDGKLDLLIQDNGLQLQLGKGDGTFQPPVRISDRATGDIVAADFDTDGFIDVAVPRGSVAGDLLEVLRGNGNGTSQRPLDFNIGRDSGPIAIGDFDSDGVVDLAVANPNEDRIAVLLNRGRA